MDKFKETKCTNVTWQNSACTQAKREDLLRRKGATIWFTGLSASGKTAVAAILEKRLLEESIPAFMLDGDNLRHGLNADLGFDRTARQENVRRTAEVAKMFAASGTIAIVSLISPYKGDREQARKIHELSGLSFLEVFMDTPLEICQKRDPKGLYAKALKGEIQEFTGIDDPYEEPQNPELVLSSSVASIEENVAKVLHFLYEHRSPCLGDAKLLQENTLALPGAIIPKF